VLNFKSFLRFLIAKIWSKIKKNHQISIHWFKHVATNIEGCFKFFTFVCILKPNLAKSSCGSLPFWLHHKIDKKKHCSRKATFDRKERQLGVDGGCQMVEWQQWQGTRPMHGMAWQGKARHAGGLENISVRWVFKSMADIGIRYIYINPLVSVSICRGLETHITF
jgi:hypothetical protein